MTILKPYVKQVYTWPFKDMKIGDAFSVAFETKQKMYCLRASAHASASRYGMRITARQCDDGLRIVRVA